MSQSMNYFSFLVLKKSLALSLFMKLNQLIYAQVYSNTESHKRSDSGSILKKRTGLCPSISYYSISC